MKRLCIIRREDFFEALALGQIPEDCNLQAGNLWCSLALTNEEQSAYSFPIWPV